MDRRHITAELRAHRGRGFWPRPEFWSRPRLPRRFWSQDHTVATLRTFVSDLERADSDERMKEGAMGRAIRALGGREKVNAADIVWYARLLDRTGTTLRRPGGARGHSRTGIGDNRESGPAIERIVLGDGGRLVIPASYRQALSLREGGEVILMLDQGELRLFTPQQALIRAQRLVRERVADGRSLAEELIAERRLEASHE